MNWAWPKNYREFLPKKACKPKPSSPKLTTMAPGLLANLCRWWRGWGLYCRSWGRTNEYATFDRNEVWRHFRGQRGTFPPVCGDRGSWRNPRPRCRGGIGHG